MKKIAIVLFTCLSFQCFIHAQCMQTASSFGNNTNIPMYNVTGDVTVTLNTGGQTVNLDLGSNFMTAAGPDIRAFLVNSNGLSDTQLAQTMIDGLENIEFGLVGNLDSIDQNGAKSFTVAIPDGTDIQNFDRVLFYCLQFDQFWDFGSYTAFSQANCNVLSVEENLLSIASMYPNPTKEVLYISTSMNNNNSEVRIFNTNGTMVVFNDNIVNPIDVSSLVAGLYMVEVTSDRQRDIKKLVIK